MKILKTIFDNLVYILAGLASIGTFLFLDIGKWLSPLVTGADFEIKLATLTLWVGWGVKVLIILLIAAGCIYFAKRQTSSKNLSYENLADRVFERHRENVKIELIGYSLGFATTILLRLNEAPRPNLSVTIYIMKKETILAEFKEQKELGHRVDIINERIKEWKTLEDENKIGSLRVIQVADLIPFAALMLNDRQLFVSNYHWKIAEKRMLLQKIPQANRLFYDITKINGAYETIVAFINSLRRNG